MRCLGNDHGMLEKLKEVTKEKNYLWTQISEATAEGADAQQLQQLQPFPLYLLREGEKLAVAEEAAKASCFQNLGKLTSQSQRRQKSQHACHHGQRKVNDDNSITKTFHNGVLISFFPCGQCHKGRFVVACLVTW